MLLVLTRGRAGIYGAHARTRVLLVLLLAVFTGAALVFALVLVTVALAARLGTLEALGVMCGACLVAAGLVVLRIRSEALAHAAALRARSDQERRLMRAALLTAVPAMRRGELVALVGLAAILALVGRQRDDDEPRA